MHRGDKGEEKKDISKQPTVGVEHNNTSVGRSESSLQKSSIVSSTTTSSQTPRRYSSSSTRSFENNDYYTTSSINQRVSSSMSLYGRGHNGYNRGLSRRISINSSISNFSTMSETSLPWTTKDIGFNAISGVLNNPNSKSSNTVKPSKNDIPSVPHTVIRKVKPADFNNYIKQITPVFERYNHNKEIGTNDLGSSISTKSEEFTNVTTTTNNILSNNLKNLQTSDGNENIIEIPVHRQESTRNPYSVIIPPTPTSTGDDRPIEPIIELPFLETVPSIFFESDFNLENPRTFDIVCENTDIIEGNPNNLGVSTNAILQEKLSHYLDTVEVHLIKEISLRSSSFFAALSNLQALHSETLECVSQINSLRQKLASIDNSQAKQGLEIVRLKRRYANMGKLYEGIKMVTEIRSTQPMIQTLLSQGDYFSALDLIDETNTILHGGDRVQIEEINNDRNLKTSILSPRQTSVRRLSNVVEKTNILDLRGVRVLIHFSGQLTEMYKMIGVMIENDLLNMLFLDFEEQSPDMSEQEKLKKRIAPLILGLYRMNRFSLALQAYRERMMEEIKKIIQIQKHLPSPILLSEHMDDQIKDLPNEQGSKLLKGMTFDAFLDMLLSIYTILLEGINCISIYHELFSDILSEAHNSGLELNFGSELFNTENESLQKNVEPNPSSSSRFSTALKITTDLNSNFMQLLSDSSQIVFAAADLAHVRCANLIAVRADQNAQLNQKDFYRLFNVTWAFVLECESLCGQITLVENEQWVQAEVPIDFQKIVNKIIVAATNGLNDFKDDLSDPLSSPLSPTFPFTRTSFQIEDKSRTSNGNTEQRSSNNSNNNNSTGKLNNTSSRYIFVEHRQFFVVGCSLLLIKMIGDYLRLILGAGAMRSAGLKNITAKHLALTSQSLGAMIALIPFIRECIRHNLNSKQIVMLTEFDRIKRVVSIMDDRLSNHLRSFQSINWDNTNVVESPNSYMESLVKETTTLNKVLNKYLPPEFLKNVMFEIYKSSIPKLSEEFSKLNVYTPAGKKQVLTDAKYYISKLSSSEGLQDLIDGLESTVNDLQIKEETIIQNSLSSNAETSPVQIWLKTSWTYFPLVEEFLRQGLFSSKLTNYEIYKSALDIIEKEKFLSTPTTKSLFEFGLSLHTKAPTIQSYYHYYNSTIIPTKKLSNEEFNSECNVWVDWYGNQACNVESLTKFIDTKLDILKYIPPKENQESLYLSGYGVELALKNTDYIVIDDRKVEADISEIKPLKAGEIKSLGVKTAQVILESKDPLKTLTQLSQDFPKYSHYISQVPLSYSLGQEIGMNQENSRLEPNSFWLNGLVINPLSVDPFSLLKLLCRERQTISSFLNLGLNPGQAIGILSSPIISEAQLSQDSPRGVFDVRQLRMIRKNIYSILFILDLSSPENLNIIVDHVNNFISRDIPLRFGFIPLFSKDQSDEIRKPSKDEFLKIVEQEFNKLIDKEVPKNEKLVNSFEEIINGNNALVEEQIYESSNFIKRFKINTYERGVLFINGKFFDLDEAYIGEINDETNIYEYLLTLPNIPNRRNPYIFTSELQPLQVINLADDNNVNDGFSLVDNLKYVHSEIDDKVPVTIILISDFNNVNGINQIIEALKYLKSTKNVRISFIHQPNQLSTQSNSENHFNPSTMIYHLLYEDEPITSNSSHFQYIFEEYLEHLEGNSRFGGDDEKQIPIGQSFYNLAHSLGWQIIENLKAEKFWQDLSYLKNSMKFEKDKTTIIVNGRIIGPFAQDDIFNDDDFKLLIDVELSERILPVVQVLDEYKLIELEGDDYSNFIAKISSIISASSVSDIPIGIFDEQEHKRDITFMKLRGDKSRIRIGNAKDAVYHIMAVIDPINDVLLTLGMDVISSWLVTPKSSIYDLDNIKLSNLDIKSRTKGIEAIFELKNILLEGHARDLTSNNRPPRGLQLQLGTNSYPSMVDTIVMANLGYFQLKANPGVWTLSLREGKSTDIFDIQSVGSEGWLSRNISEIGNEIVLNGFEGLTIYPRMIRKSDEKKKAEINIFSVASGHLYERFLSIMILSVLRHTNSTVKFWFIENFLSPSFKDFIPYMAKEYNFDYELVTYKWPHWLRAQTEKQRTIWGYKILFLDVLFPLDLDKVIFVDADQIVRTDLKELVDMDLQGAPYGYTPFCDNRPEMDGFRFWNHDLQKFRHMAAGDNLRGQYQALSVDPNSLSNLDQDLPNNMQHLIPIFSLPQDWLWCETWCKPKLDRAKRQIPEWESYDKEVANLAARIAQQKDSILVSNEIQDQKITETNANEIKTNDEANEAINDETNAVFYDDDNSMISDDETNDESKEKIIVKESTNFISSTI
ncbi:10008_t:CDS:10 [Diversispora eburnea]|uniref:10008_t:CDS:1 n=1 Tax=Diversispora eburnea TaxID=1213867 RepID=A0A9N9FF88_9GLOM|nr:10008_t:CDS:10 [Diversispora eburnea]